MPSPFLSVFLFSILITTIPLLMLFLVASSLPVAVLVAIFIQRSKHSLELSLIGLVRDIIHFS
jgi:hypothetical protein